MQSFNYIQNLNSQVHAYILHASGVLNLKNKIKKNDCQLFLEEYDSTVKWSIIYNIRYRFMQFDLYSLRTPF